MRLQQTVPSAVAVSPQETVRQAGEFGSANVIDGASLEGFPHIAFVTCAGSVVIQREDFVFVQRLSAKELGIHVPNCVRWNKLTGELAVGTGPMLLIFEPRLSSVPARFACSMRVRSSRGPTDDERYEVSPYAVNGNVTWVLTSSVACDSDVQSCDWSPVSGNSLILSTNTELQRLRRHVSGPGRAQRFTVLASMKLPNPAKLVRVSPDGRLFATVGSYDRHVKVWFRPEMRSDLRLGDETGRPRHLESDYMFIYVTHARAVNSFSWRTPRAVLQQSGRQDGDLPSEYPTNVLLTSSIDGYHRLWCESSPIESVNFYLGLILAPASAEESYGSEDGTHAAAFWIDNVAVRHCLNPSSFEPSLDPVKTPGDELENGVRHKTHNPLRQSIGFQTEPTYNGGEKVLRMSSASSTTSMQSYHGHHVPLVDRRSRLQINVVDEEQTIVQSLVHMDGIGTNIVTSGGIMRLNVDFLAVFCTNNTVKVYQIEGLADAPRRMIRKSLLSCEEMLSNGKAYKFAPMVRIYAENSHVHGDHGYGVNKELYVLAVGNDQDLLKYHLGISVKPRFQISKFEFRARLRGHSDTIRQLRLHPSKPLFASISQDELMVWKTFRVPSMAKRKQVIEEVDRWKDSLSIRCCSWSVVSNHILVATEETAYFASVTDSAIEIMKEVPEFAGARAIICIRCIFDSRRGYFVGVFEDRTQVVGMIVRQDEHDVEKVSLEKPAASTLPDLSDPPLCIDGGDIPGLGFNIFLGTKQGQVRQYAWDEDYSMWMLMDVLDDELVRGMEVSRISVAHSNLIAVSYGSSKSSKSEVYIWEAMSSGGEFGVQQRINLDGRVTWLEWTGIGDGSVILGICCNNIVQLFYSSSSGDVISTVHQEWDCLYTIDCREKFETSEHLLICWTHDGSIAVCDHSLVEIYTKWLPSHYYEIDDKQIAMENEDVVEDVEEEDVSSVDFEAQLKADAGMLPSIFDLKRYHSHRIPFYHPTVLSSAIAENAYALILRLLQDLYRYIDLISREDEDKDQGRLDPYMDSVSVLKELVPSELNELVEALQKSVQQSGQRTATGLDFFAMTRDEDEADMKDLLSGRIHRQSTRRGDDENAPKVDLGTGEFSREDAKRLRELLTTVNLPYLSSQQQLQVRSLLDIILSEENRFAGVDQFGIRYWIHVSQGLLMSRTVRQGARLRHFLESQDYCWAAISETQDTLIKLIGREFERDSSIDFLNSLGVAYWVRDDRVLTNLAESLARRRFTKNKDPLDAAPFYIAMKRVSVLRALFHTVKDKRMEAFFANDFAADRWREAALKNAYALMGKHRFLTAAAFFLLGGSLMDCVKICLNKLKSYHLAMLFCRLYEGSGGPTYMKLVDQDARTHFEHEQDYWMLALHQYMIGDTKAALNQLSQSVNASKGSEMRKGSEFLHRQRSHMGMFAFYNALYTRYRLQPGVTFNLDEVAQRRRLGFLCANLYLQNGMQLMCIHTITTMKRLEEAEAVDMQDLSKKPQAEAVVLDPFQQTMGAAAPSALDTGMVDFDAFGFDDDGWEDDGDAAATAQEEDFTLETQSVAEKQVDRVSDEDDNQLATARDTYFADRITAYAAYQLLIDNWIKGRLASDWSKFGAQVIRDKDAFEKTYDLKLERFMELALYYSGRLERRGHEMALCIASKTENSIPNALQVVRLLVENVQRYFDNLAAINEIKKSSDAEVQKEGLAVNQICWQLSRFMCQLRDAVSAEEFKANVSVNFLSEVYLTVYLGFVIVAYKTLNRSRLLGLLKWRARGDLIEVTFRDGNVDIAANIHADIGTGNGDYSGYESESENGEDANGTDADSLGSDSSDEMLMLGGADRSEAAILDRILGKTAAELQVETTTGDAQTPQANGANSTITPEPSSAAETKAQKQKDFKSVRSFANKVLHVMVAQYVTNWLETFMLNQNMNFQDDGDVSTSLIDVIYNMEFWLSTCDGQAAAAIPECSLEKYDFRYSSSAIAGPTFGEQKTPVWSRRSVGLLFNWLQRQESVEEVINRYIIQLKPNKKPLTLVLYRQPELTGAMAVSSLDARRIVVTTVKGLEEVDISGGKSLESAMMTIHEPRYEGAESGARMLKNLSEMPHGSSGKSTFAGGKKRFSGRALRIKTVASIDRFERLVHRGSSQDLQSVKDPAKVTQVHKGANFSAVAGHPNLPLYISGSTDSSIALWQWDVPHQLYQYQAPQKNGCRIANVRFDRFGTKFGTADVNGRIDSWVFDQTEVRNDMRYLVTEYDRTSGDLLYLNSSTVIATTGHRANGRNVSVHDSLLPPGKNMISQFQVIEGGGQVLSFMPKAQALVAAGKKGQICLLDVRQRRPLSSISLSGGHSVKSLSVDMTESVIAAGMSDGSIKLCSANNLKELRTFDKFHAKHFLRTAFDSGVTELHFQQDTLISVGSDGLVNLLNWKDAISNLLFNS
eukprot:Clim_evm30s253 gene=Clim_evmTU30s253